VTKNILPAITVLTAVALPSAALADKSENCEPAHKTEATPKKSSTSSSHAAMTTEHAKDVTIQTNSVTINSAAPTAHGGGPMPSETAEAKGQRDFVKNPEGLQLGAGVGFGTQESYGFGVGAKAGYTFNNRAYLGGIADYHVGNTTDVAGQTVKSRTWYVGPEVGYDFGIGGVILRPTVGFGLAVRNESAHGSILNSSDTTSRAYVAPGASLIYPIKNFFVGGDARLMFTTEETNVGLYANVGMHL
jgi:hypothetical protein